MKITIALLIYKSTAYLDFVMDSLLDHPSENYDVEYLIVCNDATNEVILHAEKWARFPDVRYVIHENSNPDDWWIQNVYDAWNRCLSECRTEAICFVNSDMAFTDGWLDSLACYSLSEYIPTSRLVESERMPSLPGLISKNFGQTLATFDKVAFEAYAEEAAEPVARARIGAFMPSLFKTSTLRAIGGWQKNVGRPGQPITPGDQITFGLLKEKGLTQICVHHSLVYHFQRGESAEVGDL